MRYSRDLLSAITVVGRVPLSPTEDAGLNINVIGVVALMLIACTVIGGVIF